MLTVADVPAGVLLMTSGSSRPVKIYELRTVMHHCLHIFLLFS